MTFLECGDSSPLSFSGPAAAKESGVETPHSKRVLACGDSSPLSFSGPAAAKESGVETPHSKRVLECGDSSPLSFSGPAAAKESGVETPHSKPASPLWHSRREIGSRHPCPTIRVGQRKRPPVRTFGIAYQSAREECVWPAARPTREIDLDSLHGAPASPVSDAALAPERLAPATSPGGRTNHPEADVVVAVPGRVVVAVGRTAVPGVVVPATAAKHAGWADLPAALAQAQDGHSSYRPVQGRCSPFVGESVARAASYCL